MKTLRLCVLCALFTGCASINQTLDSELRHPDGTVEIKRTQSRATAFWDAKQTLEKLKVSNGKTHSVGLTGVDNESSGTNAVNLIEAIVRGAVQGVAGGAK